ncbi:MAG: hypothetical protein JNJ59_14895, partial [Deltaproteobacteria bacterium]|nr:hypothetical protein [Deltaproteobacteria bacterium]
MRSSPSPHAALPPLSRSACAAALVLGLMACKPAAEPPRRASAETAFDVQGGARLGPPPELSVTERVQRGDDLAPPVVGEVARPDPTAADAGPASDTADTVAPDTAADATVADAADTLGDAFTWVADPDRLPPEVLDALARKPSAAEREEARKLNKTGLEAQKKLALDEAMAAYRAALDQWAGAPFPRFNLACALALSKADDEALFHLAVLAFSARNDKTSSDRLDAARLDADFERLRKDERFRTLTGATEIEITWVSGRAGEDGRKEARRLVQVLRDGKWLAKATSSPWPDNAQAPATSVIRVRAGDPIAERAARALQALLVAAPKPDEAPQSWPIEEGPLPTDGPPIAVVVAAPREADPVPVDPVPAPDDPTRPIEPVPGDSVRPGDPVRPGEPATPPPDGEKPGELADYLGRKLRAEARGPAGSDHHLFEL